jgi:uncharacterized membrane protein (UPF0127 family)
MYLSLGPYSSPSQSRVVLPNGAVRSAEVMDTAEKRAAGMQFRNGFPPNTVMLFAHPTPGNFRYHMKNVRSGLDLMSLDSAGRVIKIQSVRPGTDGYGSGANCQFMIEAPCGFASTNNLKIGDLIRLA